MGSVPVAGIRYAYGPVYLLVQKNVNFCFICEEDEMVIEYFPELAYFDNVFLGWNNVLKWTDSIELFFNYSVACFKNYSIQFTMSHYNFRKFNFFVKFC